MTSLERLWDPRSRTSILMLSASIILIVAVADWWTMPYVSLGFLYLFPIMLASTFLDRWMIVLLGVACAWLSELFSSLERSSLRFSFEALALAGCGLFVGELVRNRRLTLDGQDKMTALLDRLKALVETSPAAIVTVDERGFIELANQAAEELLVPRGGALPGNPIAAFLPELHHALRFEEAPQFRASMQCRCHSGNGESFTADVWFSTYREGVAPRLAAIIADATENAANGSPGPAEPGRENRAPLNDREMDVLRCLVQGFVNKEIAARMTISESAVKNTLQQLFFKAGVRTRGQLVRVALEQYRDLL